MSPTARDIRAFANDHCVPKTQHACFYDVKKTQCFFDRLLGFNRMNIFVAKTHL